MKQIAKLLFLLCGTALLLNCDYDSDDSQIIPNTPGGAVVTSFSNIINGVFLEGEAIGETGFTLDGITGTFSDYDLLVQYNTESGNIGTLASGLTTLPMDFLFTLSELAAALGKSVSDFTIGDNIHFLVRINGVSNNSSSSLISSVSTTTTVICGIEPALFTGDWTIDMSDSYGDGWQTTTGDGGPGLSFILDGVDIQVGLCTPYEPPSYSCVSELSSGTATINVPPGSSTIEVYFPGDYWGEISFSIKRPDGTVVASGDTGTPAGRVYLNVCL